MNFARHPHGDARFLYELAEHLHKTVGELVGLMDDPAEVTGWRALFEQRALEREREAAKDADRAEAARLRTF